MSSRKQQTKRGKASTKKKPARHVSESESDNNSDVDDNRSDTESIRETLVMEVRVPEHKVKALLKGREVSKKESLKPMAKAETYDVDHNCSTCPRYQKKIRELRLKLKGVAGEDEQDRIPLALPAIDKNGKEIRFKNIPGRACDWDTELFDWEPIMLPYERIGDRIRFGDYFCSEECAAAYSLKLNDKDVEKRRGLINTIASMRRGKTVSVKPSSTPRIMKKFGGTDTVAEFRKRNGIGKRTYNAMPIAAVQVVTMLDTDQLGMARNDSDALVLKRTTPLNNASSLERSMRLRFKKKDGVDSDDEAV